MPASQSIAAQSNRGRALSWAHPLPNRARTCHRGAAQSGPTRRSGHILAPIGTHQNVTQLRMPDAVAGTSSATERLAGGSAASDEKSKLITGMGAESMAACCLPKLSVAARCSRSAQACVALTISGDHRLSVVNFMNAHLRPSLATNGDFSNQWPCETRTCSLERNALNALKSKPLHSPTRTEPRATKRCARAGTKRPPRRSRCMWSWRAMERIPSARRSSLTCHPVALKGPFSSAHRDLISPRRSSLTSSVMTASKRLAGADPE